MNVLLAKVSDLESLIQVEREQSRNTFRNLQSANEELIEERDRQGIEANQRISELSSVIEDHQRRDQDASGTIEYLRNQIEALQQQKADLVHQQREAEEAYDTLVQLTAAAASRRRNADRLRESGQLPREVKREREEEGEANPRRVRMRGDVITTRVEGVIDVDAHSRIPTE